LSTSLAGMGGAEFNCSQDDRLGRRLRHIAFGSGIHTCMDMHLDRGELRIATKRFPARTPASRIADGQRLGVLLISQSDDTSHQQAGTLRQRAGRSTSYLPDAGSAGAR